MFASFWPNFKQIHGHSVLFSCPCRCASQVRSRQRAVKAGETSSEDLKKQWEELLWRAEIGWCVPGIVIGKCLHIEGISLFCGSGYRACTKQSVMTSSPYYVLPQFNFHGLKPSGIAGVAYGLSPLPEVKVVQELCAWKNTRVIARWCSSPIAKLAFIIPITGI